MDTVKKEIVDAGSRLYGRFFGDQNRARGVRNNNPGNIRISRSKWRGKLSTTTDDAFEQFESPVLGIRATARLLKNYQSKHDLASVGAIVERWAPPEDDNDTNAYADRVADELDVGVGDYIDLSRSRVLANLTKAIIRHENGEMPYSDDEIDEGVRLA